MEASQGISLKVKVFEYQLAYCEDGDNWLDGTGEETAGSTGLFKPVEKSTTIFMSDKFNKGIRFFLKCEGDLFQWLNHHRK